MASELELARRFRQALAPQAPALRTLARRGVPGCATCLVGIGAIPIIVQVNAGVPSIQPDVPLLYPWDFAVRGSARAWAALWQPYPEPGWHDLFALAKRGELSMEGNLLPFMASLQYFKDLLALPREVAP